MNMGRIQDTKKGNNMTIKKRISRPSRSSFNQFFTGPAVKYIAGGLAAAVLTRLVSRLSGRYPELSKFLEDNIDVLEENVDQFKHQLTSETSRSRH